MDLSDFYPSPGDLIQSELSVLDHLRRSTYINRNHSQVAAAANNYYRRNTGSRSDFEFQSYFDIWHPPMHRRRLPAWDRGAAKPNARLTVSARIGRKNGNFTEVTYCLSVCRLHSVSPPARLAIYRKFHFDVTVADDGGHSRRQPHPRCHLQYCGEMVPIMRDIGCKESQLNQMQPWLSEPRIFFWPMSLALLIDMALHEFPDQASTEFRSESGWHRLVREQEALVLRPFCQKCIEIIDARGRDRTLADAFYVS
jgi:hypothetical protein